MRIAFHSRLSSGEEGSARGDAEFLLLADTRNDETEKQNCNCWIHRAPSAIDIDPHVTSSPRYGRASAAGNPPSGK